MKTPARSSIATAERLRGALPPHYVAIWMEAKRVAWPERFATDLTTWDRLALTGESMHHETGERLTLGDLAPIAACEPFGWVLRPDGTHILPVRTSETRLRASSVIHAFGAESCRFYAWDGCALLSMRCAAELDAWIDEQIEARKVRGEARS